MTTTIRVSTHTRDVLQEIARERGVSMNAVLDEAVERLRRERLLKAMNDAYAELRKDPEAWADVERERAEWDATLPDGLEGSY